jgi:hypothetical protein
MVTEKIMNINKLKSTLNALGGPAKTSKFYVRITGIGGEYEKYVEFLCDAAVLPGIAFQTTEVRHLGYGNIDKRPYMTIFTDVNLSFLVDNKGEVYKYFHKWMRSVVNFSEYTNSNKTVSGLHISHYAFPDQYLGTVEIMHLDDEGNTIISYKLNKAYPIQIADVQVAWENIDTLARLPITFAYNSWETEQFEKGKDNEKFDSLRNNMTRIDRSASNGFNELIGAVNTVAQTVNTIKNIFK